MSVRDSLPVMALAATSSPVFATAPDDLGPSSDPPWNPPGPIKRRRMWETVLLCPQRLATYPITGLGIIADRGLLYVEDTALLQKLAFVATALPSRTGIRPMAAELGDRTGLGAAIELRSGVRGGPFLKSLRLAHSASTRNYHRTTFHAGRQPLSLAYQYEWRPEERFYGLGMNTTEDSLANQATQFEHVYAGLGHKWNADETGRNPRTEIATWFGPRMQVVRKGREPGAASIEERFPSTVANTLGQRREHLVYGARVSSDWRVGGPHWTHGWRALLEAQRYDAPLSGLALHTSSSGAQFTRSTIELETGMSFMRDPRSVRFLGRVIDQGISSGADRMMVADLASLGGGEGLWGFPAGRFHDLDLVLARVSYVFPLARRFELDLHAESGGVFADVWESARLAAFEQSFGVALRIRTKSRPVGFIGIDATRESMRIRYSIGNPE